MKRSRVSNPSLGHALHTARKFTSQPQLFDGACARHQLRRFKASAQNTRREAWELNHIHYERSASLYERRWTWLLHNQFYIRFSWDLRLAWTWNGKESDKFNIINKMKINSIINNISGSHRYDHSFSKLVVVGLRYRIGVFLCHWF